MKKIILILVIIFAVIIITFCVRFIFGGPEDDWICSNNAWIKHGNPTC